MIVNSIELNFKKQDGSRYKVRVPFAKPLEEITDANTKINDLKNIIISNALIEGQQLIECVSAEYVSQEINEVDLESGLA